MMGKYKVKINYKSGQSVVIRCDEFSMERDTNGVMTVTWSNATPKILSIGPNDIESVWQL